jgi:hypothetical protein
MSILKTTTAMTPPDSIGGYTSETEGGGGSITTNSGRVRRYEGLKLNFEHKSAEWLDNYERKVTGREMIITDIIRRNVKWLNNAIVDGHDLGPGEKFPDTDKQNEGCDESEWREFYGEDVGPWSNGHVVTFLDPETGLAYWWPTQTTSQGATWTIRDLAADIKRMREFRTALVYPKAKLVTVVMKSKKYADTNRPFLETTDWVVRMPDGGVAAAPDMPKLTRAEPVTLAEEAKDKIPY